MRNDINSISIGSQVGADLSFNGDDILSISYENTVDIIGDELAIDTFTPVVNYEGETDPEVFVPTDYDAFAAHDGLIFCGHYQGDITDAYYGQPIYYNRNGRLFGKYYIKSLERTARTQYQFNAMSAIGILDVQYHVGGVYSGATAQTVITEIVGNTLTYSFGNTFKNVKVYGWMPYDTKRNNLHRLLFALGGSVLKDADGNMVFDFLDATSAPATIDDSYVYLNGSVVSNLPVSEVRVTEHSYQYLPNQNTVTLFDNTNATAATNQLVKFSNAPIKKTTITATGLIMSAYGENYAIVSGKGIITGIPYLDVANIVARTKSVVGESKTIEIKDIGLINPVNSENAADRLMAYYSSPNEVDADFVNNGEKCGNRYSFTNAFNESITAFLSHTSNTVSTIIKSAAKFIQNYLPTNVGNNYNNLYSYTSTTLSSAFTFPSGTTKARLVLIGGGRGGYGGAAGDVASNGKGGEGGKGGNGGEGGRIQIVTIDVEAGDFLELKAGYEGTAGAGSNSHNTNPNGNVGGTSYIYHYGAGRVLKSTYTSSSGESSATGYYEPTSGITYALPGENGVDGGDGGNSGYCTVGTADTDKRQGHDGESVGTHTGGVGGAGAIITLSVAGTKEVPGAGGGGGGASVDGNGTNGGAASITNSYTHSEEEYWNGRGGNGGNGSAPSARADATVYGQGGDGGHGGGGAGAAGTCETVQVWNNTKYSIVGGSQGTNGSKANGGNAGKGMSGICLVYY